MKKKETLTYTGGRSQFTPSQIRGIRRARNDMGYDWEYVARLYHTTPNIIRNIINGKTYRGVK